MQSEANALSESALKLELLQQAERQGRDGEPIDARSVLNEHPQFWDDKSFVVELAYEEFLQHGDLGQEINAEEFCDQFPLYRSTLQRLLALNQLVQHNPSLFDERRPPWPSVGKTWLAFHLLEELGRGAFSRVYLALEERVGRRKVALKVSLAGAAEAELLGRLDHPHIVPILGIHHDAESGWTAISMPYHGRYTFEDVKDGAVQLTRRGIVPQTRPTRAAERSIPVSLVFRMGAQVASALTAAHAHNIIHGDLKPSNILIDDKGNACVLDFNLAGQIEEIEPRHGGSLPYMAPEQLERIASRKKGASRDPRSDIFALGVILHELLTDRHPYAADFARISGLPLAQLAREMLERQQSSLRMPRYPGLEPAATRILRSCLALEARDRPASAADLVRSLQSRLTLRARCHRQALAHPRQAVAAGLLAVGLAMGSVTWLANRPSAAERRLARGEGEIRAGQLSAGIENVQFAVAADPDSRRARLALAYAYQARGDLSLALAEYEELRQRFDEPMAWAGIAYCEAALGHQPFAIEAGKQALQRGLRFPEVLNNLAFSLTRRSQFDEAKTLLTEAIGLDSKSSVLYLNRALCLWMQSQQAQEITPVEAMDDICAAVALDPTSPGLRVMAARIAAGRVGVDPAAATLLDDSLSAAMQLGWDWRRIAADPFLSPFSNRPVLQGLPVLTGPIRPLPEPTRLLPPFSLTQI